MDAFFLNSPTKIYFGHEVFKSVPTYIAARYSSALIVFSQSSRALAEELRVSLDSCGIPSVKIPISKSEPGCLEIDTQTNLLSAHMFDVIIALGGGKALDFGKALAVTLTNKKPVWDFVNLSNKPPVPITEKVLSVISVPTNVGTGSEVTPYSVLFNEAERLKGTIQQSEIIPQAAFIDFELIKTSPLNSCLFSSIDCLSQALESFLNVSKFSPPAEMYSAECIRQSLVAIPLLANPETEVSGRKSMAWASVLSGLAISNRGTTLVHAIAEPLGAKSGLSHGETVSLFLLPVLEWTARKAPSAIASLGRRTGLMHCEVDDITGARHTFDSFVRVCEKIFLDDYLLEARTRAKGLISAAELCNDVLEYKFRPMKQHPVSPDKEELMEIINKALFSSERYSSLNRKAINP